MKYLRVGKFNTYSMLLHVKILEEKNELIYENRIWLKYYKQKDISTDSQMRVNNTLKYFIFN